MNLEGKRIGVTGATGMVGRYLMRALHRRGAHAIAVVRSPDKPPSLAAQGFEVRRADLADCAALEKAFVGLDAVLANAALIALGGQAPATVLANNVEGTRNVFLAMARQGVRRAVLTSSAVVYEAGVPGPVREDAPLRRADGLIHRLNCYPISKAEAERVAQTVSAEHGIGLSIARPHQIHGAYDQNGFTLWFRRMMAPRWLSLWVTHMYYPSVYAGALAEAICRMLEIEAAVGEAFNIAGEPGKHSFWDYARAWGAAGQRVPKVLIPFPWPSRRSYSIDKAERILGWRPGDLVEEMRELAALPA